MGMKVSAVITQVITTTIFRPRLNGWSGSTTGGCSTPMNLVMRKNHSNQDTKHVFHRINPL